MEKFTWRKVEDYSKYEEYWYNELFDTFDDCIKDAKEQGVEGEIVVAIAIPYKPIIEADDILEKIENEVYEDYDIDFEFVQDEKVDELSERLTEVLRQWLKETCQKPNCFRIDDKSKVVIKI